MFGGRQTDINLSSIKFNQLMNQDLQLYKIVLIGNSGTGKTNITTRYIKGQFYQDLHASVGVQFFAKTVPIKGKDIKITLWDTVGQERYKSLSNIYYKGARGILVVYDITDPQSYVDIQSWLRLANETVNLSEITVFVVGNKIDLGNERKVSFDRVVKEYKQKFDLNCWQVSAKTGYHINEMFASMFEKIHQKGIEGQSSVLYAESQKGTYSEIDRDSAPHAKRLDRQMVQIGETIREQRQSENSSIHLPKNSYFESILALVNGDQTVQQKRKTRKCCH